MTDDSVEILKAAAEGSAEGAVRGLFAPVADFVSAVFGAPARELALYLAEGIRSKRLERQAALFIRARELVDSAGIEPKEVRWKVLVPLLQGAADEDPEDESMFERWAALLANAAAGAGGKEAVLPSFPLILSELSSEEALMLDDMGRHALARPGLPPVDPEALMVYNGLDDDDLSHLRLLNLKRLGLCELEYDEGKLNVVRLTPIGFMFVRSCWNPAVSDYARSAFHRLDQIH